jgi:toxin ParE1/3/4
LAKRPALTLEVAFTPKAVTDLTSIASYSVREWGEEQARDYVAGLELACNSLGRHSRLGREVDGFRRWRYERHLIYYVARERKVLIVRILHERMIPSRHL